MFLQHYASTQSYHTSSNFSKEKMHQREQKQNSSFVIEQTFRKNNLNYKFLDKANRTQNINCTIQMKI